MKHIYVVSIISLWAVIAAKANQSDASGPSRKEQRADYLFEQQSFQSAADLYEELLAAGERGNVRVHLKAAESYYELNNPAQAVQHYGYASWEPNAAHVQASHRWHYAQTLVRVNQFALAEQVLADYLAEVPTHQAAHNLRLGLQQRTALYADSTRFTLKTLKSNSPEADFCPAFYQQGLVFSSARKENGRQKTYHRDMGAYLQLYYTPLSAQQPPADSVRHLFGKHFVSLHQGPAVFFANDSKMFLTTNNPYSEKSGNKASLSIVFNCCMLKKMERASGCLRWHCPSTTQRIQWAIRLFLPTACAYTFARISPVDSAERICT